MRFHQAVTFLPVDQGFALARAADEQGYDGVYVSDHMFFPRERRSRYTYSTRDDGAPDYGDHWAPETHWPDVWCYVAAMAAVTTRLQFTSGVYVAPARDLMTVAKQVGTVSVLSAGRVNLGVGVGWSQEEFDATGQAFTNRGKRLDDMIPALRALWAGDWVEYHGPYYDVPLMRMEPSPGGHVNIYGGGHSAPAFRRAAELCDGWIAAGAYKDDEAEGYLTSLLEARAHAGRTDEPFDIFLSLSSRPSLDTYRHFEERFGVTDFLCAPGLLARVDPALSAEAQVRARVDASARFADEILAKA